ncbi:unnamed protein product [Arctogadus glacialis]
MGRDDRADHVPPPDIVLPADRTRLRPGHAQPMATKQEWNLRGEDERESETDKGQACERGERGEPAEEPNPNPTVFKRQNKRQPPPPKTQNDNTTPQPREPPPRTIPEDDTRQTPEKHPEHQPTPPPRPK